MHTTLRVALIIYALSLFAIIIHLLKKDRLPENYATLWFAFSIIILLVGIVPEFLTIISKALGFEVLSNFIIGILIALLTIMCIALNVMIASQKKKITFLIQELSMLKKEYKEKKQ